jgi:predicted phage terminase large subunit-like protein
MERLRKLRAVRSRFSAAASVEVGRLQDFIPAVTPEFSAPVHLQPLTDVLERAAEEPVRFCFSVPPRHGKSQTLLHWFAWILRQEPRARLAYVTYGDDFAREQVAACRRIALRAGVRIGDIDQAGYFTTPEGGCVRGVSVQGQLTGRGYHFIVVDDPHKNRQEAESATVRRRVIDGFTDDISTRLEPSGTSIIVVHTRWHVSDLIGHLTAERGWEYRNLPAVDDDGRALAPELWPVERLRPFMANAYSWASLYQGQPRARGAEVFRDPVTCYLADVPAGRAGIGVDLAYTAKTQADHSIAVVLVEAARAVPTDPRVWYVRDVVRRQCAAPDFVSDLKRLRASWPGSRMRWYAAGTEKGAADFIVRAGVPMEVLPPKGDKFVRSQAASAAWNDGRIVVPRDAPWSADFLDVVTRFTGVNDPQDDDVDALAAAFDLHDAPPPARARPLHIRGL